MTVSNSSNRVVAQGNGLVTSFSYNFIMPNAADAVVIYTDTSGNQTTLSPTQYTILGIGNASGGTVTYPLTGSPIATGTTLTIARIVPIDQTTSLTGQGPPFGSVEAALDYLTYIAQQLNSSVSESLQGPVTDPLGLDYTLPSVAQRAGQILSFDSQGNVIVGQPSSGVIISSVMQPVVQAATLALARAAMGIINQSGTAPTQTIKTSGSGTYTTPVGALWLRVRMAGGGGSGSVGGNSPANGNAGSATTFGTAFLTANGGPAGNQAGTGASASATATGGDINIPGGQGGPAANQSTSNAGSNGGGGGNNAFGGGGAGGSGSSGPTGGQMGATNSGAGGGGGASIAANQAGAGGNAGAYLEKIIVGPAATYAFAVGTGGAAVNGNIDGSGSGAGALGIIIIEEHYNY